MSSNCSLFSAVKATRTEGYVKNLCDLKPDAPDFVPGVNTNRHHAHIVKETIPGVNNDTVQNKQYANNNNNCIISIQAVHDDQTKLNVIHDFQDSDKVIQDQLFIIIAYKMYMIFRVAKTLETLPSPLWRKI